ncbi:MULTISPECIES: hypothetical protein [unclassified Pseudoalteromonas]|uniref:hypothetical protein n=1 Tax=unclassified Pseudoalteromonas TaxID=194690 RepID=UPI000CF6BACF|nr:MULTISPECIES: hypothetical protein [unclassified Pseudoalteromonas]
MPDWFEDFLLLLNNSSAALIVPAIIVLAIIKDAKGIRFALLTAGFFLYGALIHEWIFSWDTQKFWRYVIWAGNDITWMAIIAYWGVRGKVHLWQSIMGQLIVVAVPFLQMWRLADRHLWDLSYNSAYLFKTIIPIINIATIVLCYLPIVYWLKARAKPTAAN